jgi:hypothetical protein
MLMLYSGKRPTIYQKITALIIVTGLFFFGLFFSIYYYTIEQEDEVYDVTRNQFDNEVESLI